MVLAQADTGMVRISRCAEASRVKGKEDKIMNHLDDTQVAGLLILFYLLGFFLCYSMFWFPFRKAIKKGYKGMFLNSKHKYYSNEEPKEENRIR